MLKKSLLSIAVIAASVASVSAFAADKSLPQQKVNVGVNVALAGINDASIESKVKSAGGSYSAKQGNFGWGVDAGYAYKIMPSFYLGADLGYQDNGKSTGKDTSSNNYKIRSKMVTLLATADYYVMPSWDVFGKFGPAYVMQTLTSPTVKNKTNKIRPYIGVGTGYTFDNGIYTNIAYDHLFGSTGNDDNSFDQDAKPAIRSVNTVQLSVGYNFAI